MSVLGSGTQFRSIQAPSAALRYTPEWLIPIPAILTASISGIQVPRPAGRIHRLWQ
jgi:hypothetical protein